MTRSRYASAVRRLAGAAAIVTGLALVTAGEARAQACVVVEDVPSTFLEDYLDTLAGLFPLSAAECEKIAKSAVSSCHKAVSASASCAEAQIGGARKGAKTACKAQGAGEEQCSATIDELLRLVESQLDADADGAHQTCDEGFAGTVQSSCQGLN